MLDSRPLDEFRRMSIPSGINVPGGELAYRIGDLAPDPNTVVVVNCAGRTRSILGAESLRRAGIPNRVVALRNGTMGWELAGLAGRARADRALSRPASRPDRRGRAPARAPALPKRRASGVIGPLDLERFEEDPERTVYVLDVRDPAEFAAGHRPGSRNAPGGQLMQATDPVDRRARRPDRADRRRRRARPHDRAPGCARWAIATCSSSRAGSTSWPSLARRRPLAPEVDETRRRSREGAVVVDLARSIDFRAGHIPGAVWGMRTRLDALRERLRAAAHVVVTSPDGVLARLAVAELRGLTEAPVQVLHGRHDGWVDAGGTLEAEPDRPAGRGVRRLLSAAIRSQLRRGGGDARLSRLGDRPGARDRARRDGCVRRLERAAAPGERTAPGGPRSTCCCRRTA